MVREWPVEVLQRLAVLFSMRLRGEAAGDIPDSWQEIYIHCIGKVPKPVRVTNWRPLSLLNAIEKLYDRCVTRLLKLRLPIVTSRSLGFAQGHQAQEGVQILLDLTMRSAEWGLPLAVARSDVNKAFDSMDRAELAATLSAGGAHPGIVASVLEALLATLDVHMGPVRADQVPFLVGGRQGASSTPEIWKHLLHRAIGEELVRLEREGHGFHLIGDHLQEDGRVINHIIFADDVWLIGRSHEELLHITTLVTAALVRRRLRWKTDEKMQCCFNRYVADAPQELMTVAGPGWQFDFRRTNVVECLGAKLDIDGDTSTLVEGRLEAMTQHFWARAKELRNKRVPLTCRLWRYARTVRRTAIYLSGCFVWTQAVARRVRTLDEALVRKVWQPRRRAGETYEFWQSRTIHGVRAQLLRLGIPTLVQEMLSASHRWAGHLARMGTDATAIAKWRDTAWWEGYAAHMCRVDATNELGWRHSRPGRQQRWDADLTRTLGPDWREKAADRTTWSTHERAFVTQLHGELLPPKAGRALCDADGPGFRRSRAERYSRPPQWQEW